MRDPSGRQDLECRATFITVSADCPAEKATVPRPKGGRETVASVQYALLAEEPHRYTQPEILFETYLRRSELSAAEKIKRRDELWDVFFSKSMACLRASPLPKTYGWGLHFDAEGKGALVARESKEYARLAELKKSGLKVVAAMRNQRAKE